MKGEQIKRSPLRKILNFLIGAFILTVLVSVYVAPSSGPFVAGQNVALYASHAIGLCLNQYADDHGGRYPEGKTSTEVFQHLIDEKYVTDPSIFYCEFEHIPGKVRPEGTHLAAENICWDVTCCVDASASDSLPVVFLTGYRITYVPGSRAVPVNSISPSVSKTWYERVFGLSRKKPYIAICYKGNNARSIEAEQDGSIPNIIPADFDAKGKAYRQLTP